MRGASVFGKIGLACGMKEIQENMAMDYRMIVLDLDGTLTNRDKIITPRTKSALMRAQEKGYIVVLASGRPTAGVEPLEAISCPTTGE